VLDWNDYLQLFKDVRHETAVGEASVAYLASLSAAAAIRARLPDARIVMMLRNPIDRLFGRYLAARDSGNTTTFPEWLDRHVAEGEGRGSIWPGRYAVHLQRYLASFPAEQIRVFVYDDYVRAPRDVLRDLFEFLGVDPEFRVDIARHHNVSMARRWPSLHTWLRTARHLVPEGLRETVRPWFLTPRRATPTGDDRAKAIEVYREDIRALEQLIQRDLSSWRAERSG
jgi:hypothetical protein